MRSSHILIAAKMAVLIRGEDGTSSADCVKTPGSFYASGFPAFSFNDFTGTTRLPDNSLHAPFPFAGWNPSNEAPGSKSSFSFGPTIPTPFKVDESSVEQQTLQLPPVQRTDAPVVPTVPTLKNVKRPTVQPMDDTQPPAKQPLEAPKTSVPRPAPTTTPPTAVTPPSPTKPSKATNTSRTASSSKSELCAKMRVQLSEVNLDVTIDSNEDEVNLKVVAIAPLPSGGSRIAVHSDDGVIVWELDENDKLVTGADPVKVPVHDFADLYADEKGFVLLGTRDAEGGGTLNCGNPSNLCGEAPNPSVPCYDMYLIRYDGASESWAAKLTSSSTSLPPYSSSKTGPDVYMIWWYAHHGRIASDGTNWAAYFGCAISTSEGGCINIHQGDRMKVVDPSGKVLEQSDAFDWGCSHSGYERITYDSRKNGYTSICKTDNNNRIIPPNDWSTTIYPVDLAASNLGDIVPDNQASNMQYWASVSNGDGENAQVHLIHFAINAAADKDITLDGTDANERAPHLATIGKGGLLVMWEGSSTGGDLVEGSARKVYAQVFDMSSGKTISTKVPLDKSVVGNRYQALKSFPDGSVAYLSKGTTDTSVQVVRFFGC